MNWKVGIPALAVVVILAGSYFFRHPDESLATLRAHDGPVRAVACSPDGKTIASVGDDGRVYVWDATSYALIRDWAAHGGRIRAVSFGPTEQLVTGADDHTVRVWNAASGTEKLNLDAGGKAVECVAVGKHWIVAGGVDKFVRIWSIDGKLVHTLKGHTKHIHAAALSPDEKLLATGGSGGVLRFWEPATGKSLGTVTVKGAHFEALAFTPDGRSLLGGGGGMGVKLFDVTRRTDKAFEGDDPGTLFAALSADGSKAASVHEDGLVRMWDVAQAKQLGQFRGHRSGVTTVAFIPNSPFLVTGAADATLKIWAAK